MLGTVFGVVLLAAAVHAGWNAIVKGADDKLLTTITVAAAAAAVAIVALPWLPQPDRASWPFIVVSSVFQVAYFVLLANAYRVADMSRAYPVMRGTAPLLVALASAFWISESLSAMAWVGISVICFGILTLTAGSWRGGKGMSFALLNAVVIASYTLIDGTGVRRSGAPVAYTLWVFLLTGIPLAGWAITTRRAAFARCVGRHGHLGLIGGIGTIASYAAALWAMTIMPVAVVAALRETSILFGTAISALVLKERVSPARIAAACIITLGAAALRLA
ncbi:MAG TPA: SMR family transporter [Acetobacteraceae bacterium]